MNQSGWEGRLQTVIRPTAAERSDGQRLLDSPGLQVGGGRGRGAGAAGRARRWGRDPARQRVQRGEPERLVTSGRLRGRLVPVHGTETAAATPGWRSGRSGVHLTAPSGRSLRQRPQLVPSTSTCRSRPTHVSRLPSGARLTSCPTGGTRRTAGSARLEPVPAVRRPAISGRRHLRRARRSERRSRRRRRRRSTRDGRRWRAEPTGRADER